MRGFSGLALLATYLFLRPGDFPLFALAALALAAIPAILAWRAARGTALRPAVAWMVLALALGGVAEVSSIGKVGGTTSAPWAYLSSLAVLAALISVFGARSPGGGAWAILMGLLVLVFLIPWFETGGGRSGEGATLRPRLEAPWSLFYLALAVAGVTNYLPTKFGRAAAWLGLSLTAESLELMGLPPMPGPPGRLGPFLLACALLRGWADSRRRSLAGPGLPALWSWFRDHWGVVWSLRVRERFHRAAEAAEWPVGIHWSEVASTADAEGGEQAARTFAGLLRRFASGEQIERATLGATPKPCPPGPSPGE